LRTTDGIFRAATSLPTYLIETRSVWIDPDDRVLAARTLEDCGSVGVAQLPESSGLRRDIALPRRLPVYANATVGLAVLDADLRHLRINRG